MKDHIMMSAFGVAHGEIAKGLGDRAAKAYLTGKASIQAGKLRKLAGNDAVNDVVRAAQTRAGSGHSSVTLYRMPRRGKNA